jgi:hypothetical protein
MKCKCGNIIPEKRTQMGYKVCVDCSTTERYGCIDIVYHKTGNTIEILEAEDARKMKKLAQRRGFGSLRSMGPGSSETGKKNISIGASTAFIGNEQSFEREGERAMLFLETFGKEKAIHSIETARKDCRISSSQALRLVKIITILSPEEKASEHTREAHTPSQEIMDVFKYWKS